MEALRINKEFLDEYGDMISKYIWSKDLQGRPEYDDLYNDVIIKLIESKEKYDSSRGAVSTWVTWVMRTVVYNYFRHKQQDATHNSEMLGLDTESDPSDHEDVKRIISRAQGLTDYDREVLIGFYHYGYTHSELAERHKVKENTMYQTVHRAKNKLSSEIQGELTC